MSANLRRSGRLAAANPSLTITTAAATRKRRATHLPITSTTVAFQETQPKKRKFAQTNEIPGGKDKSDCGETSASSKDSGKVLEEVARREKELARREERIEQREGKGKRMERVLEGREKEVRRREVEVERREAIVRERKEDVEVREQMVGEREVAIGRKEDELKKREGGMREGGSAGPSSVGCGPGNRPLYPRSFSLEALQAWIEGREEDE